MATTGSHRPCDPVPGKRKLAHRRGPTGGERAGPAGSPGGQAWRECRALRHEALQAMREVLTEEQRGKVPGILREESREWRNTGERNKRLKAIADQLGLNEEQREKIGKIHAGNKSKIDQLEAQLKE